MKNFIFAVLVFCIMALADSASAAIPGSGPGNYIIGSRAFKSIPDWRKPFKPVTVSFELAAYDTYGRLNEWANNREIMRRLERTGASHQYADNLLFGALNENYNCPYLDYGHDIEEFFPASVDIVLLYEFDRAKNPLSAEVVAMLETSGLKHSQAQSIFYYALEEHLGCLLEP